MSTEYHITTVLGERYESRFWSRIEKTDGCWIWTGGITSHGYGSVKLCSWPFYAHRLSFEMAHGSRIADGQTLDHLCRNRLCVNPEHLEPVSIGENVLRGETHGARNAAKTHCGTCGHPLSGDNLLVVQPTGKRRSVTRRCYACAQEGWRRYYLKNRDKYIEYTRRYKHKKREGAHRGDSL